MRTEELEAHLQFIHPQVFSFTFALIPEQLQADQIILDSLSRLFIERNDLIREIMAGHNPNYQKTQNRLSLALMECVYPLALKRADQLQENLGKGNDIQESPAFFQLSLPQRAVLFLKAQTIMSWDDVALICGMERYMAISYVTAAREHLAELCGLEVPDLSRVEGAASDSEDAELHELAQMQYLYAPQNQELAVKAFEKESKCPLALNLFPYLDATESVGVWEKYESHLSSCTVCQKGMDRVKHFYQDVHQKVPSNKISRECQIQFESDLRDLLKEQELPELREERGFKAWVERLKRTSLTKYYVAIGLFVFAGWVSIFRH